MTPAARVQAAIEILDQILGGAVAEQVLTNWGRQNRYAGSKDRQAIRDHVFDALRCKRSFGHLGGGADGRAIMIGACRAAGADPITIFTGEGHAPKPLSDAELTAPPPLSADAVGLDCPDWLWDGIGQSLGGDGRRAALAVLQTRAPVFLRVNLLRSTREAAIKALAKDDIQVVPHDTVETALIVTENPRRIANSAAFADGLIELQDASSQSACLHLGVKKGDRVLDYCAGGGGKSLALAALGVRVTAHDIDPQRMADLPVRAARAGAKVAVVRPQELAKSGESFDLVFCDAPCSGSGTWRRTPDAKWRLAPDRLDQLTAIQRDVLEKAMTLVGPDGRLAYATCSIFCEENQDQTAAFVARHPEFVMVHEQIWQPTQDGDGFYLCVLARRK